MLRLDLLRVLLAIGLPAVILYFRLVLAILASGHRVTPEHSLWLLGLSNVLLVVFIIVQLLAAYYLQRFLPSRKGGTSGVLQYAGMVVLCGACSVAGAIVLESFAYNLILRVLNAPR